MGKFKVHAIVGLVCYVLGMAVVWHFRAPETKIEYKEKVVEKEVVKRNIVTRTIRLPNGTVKTETIDRSESVTDKQAEVAHKSETKPAPTKYSVSITKLLPIREPLSKDFSVSAGTRLVGPVWAEVGYSTNKTITLGARVEF